MKAFQPFRLLKKEYIRRLRNALEFGKAVFGEILGAKALLIILLCILPSKDTMMMAFAPVSCRNMGNRVL